MFLFKQKTAYELRISDWSSDVCSSDLEPVAQQRVRRVARQGDRIGALERERRLRRRRQRLCAVAALELRQRTVFGQDHIGLGHAQPLQRPAERVEIGRASCRERVCQNVSIRVVAGSLKKQKKKL